MGDGGALVIGFLLSVMAIKLWNVDSAISGNTNDRIFHIMAYSMLFVPCLDVIRVVLRRARHKKPLFLPDKTHIHHKFMALGLTPQKSLLPIIAIQLFFAGLNVFLSFKLDIITIAAIDITIWSVFHVWLTRKIDNKLMIKKRSQTVL